MEGSASRLQRNSSRVLQHNDEVGGQGRADFPYDRGGVKYAQAVISQTRDGNWKLTLQSDHQVEMMLESDTLEMIIKELKSAASKEWEQRS